MAKFFSNNDYRSLNDIPTTDLINRYKGNNNQVELFAMFSVNSGPFLRSRLAAFAGPGMPTELIEQKFRNRDGLELYEFYPVKQGETEQNDPATVARSIMGTDTNPNVEHPARKARVEQLAQAYAKVANENGLTVKELRTFDAQTKEKPLTAKEIIAQFNVPQLDQLATKLSTAARKRYAAAVSTSKKAAILLRNEDVKNEILSQKTKKIVKDLPSPMDGELAKVETIAKLKGIEMS